MARQGVFSRELNSLEGVKRSLQRLQHRHTFDTRYGQIVPNFSEILYPGETLHLNTTNFLRTIPMVTPQLSRVRIFQRFVAVPMRIMWQPWEDYINAINPQPVTPVEPYICNFNRVGTIASGAAVSAAFSVGLTYSSLSQAVSVWQSLNANVKDFSALGLCVSAAVRPSTTVGFGRVISFDKNDMWTELSGYQFFPHELGDYLNAPLFSVGLSSLDASTRFSAFKFCAYQLAYAYFYRRPNVEKRVDDYYETNAVRFGNDLVQENPAIYGVYNGTNIEPAISQNTVGGSNLIPSAATPATYASDLSISSDASDAVITTWENCLKFPLRAGANFSLTATDRQENGRDLYYNSRISLTRMRYAPWLMDRFTSANPWPQRNDEALIPVNGIISVTLPDSTTVSFSNLSATIPSTNIAAYIEEENASSVSSPKVSLLDYDSTETNHYSFKELGADKVEGFSPNSSIYGTLYFPATQASVSGSASASFSSASANVTHALSISPSNFRFYMQLQHAKEKSGMTDGRYQSYLSMFFNSRVSSNQLDQPQFIGGFVQDLDISEIQQTSESGTTPLGTLAGKGVSAKRSSTISFHANEHTVILGLIHILPDAEYIGGLNRVDHTTNPFDWVLPDFAGISEQPIRNSELCMRSSSFTTAQSAATNDAAFGYEPRFNELRARHNYVTGAFRDTMNATGTRDYYQPWIVKRNFGFDSVASISNNIVTGISLNIPTLSKEFLSTRGTVDASNFAVTNEQVMYPFMCDSYFDERIARIIPTRGIPRI